MFNNPFRDNIQLHFYHNEMSFEFNFKKKFDRVLNIRSGEIDTFINFVL